MTSYYKCRVCNYLTKNKEYADFHTRNLCKATEFQSEYEGKGGLIYFSKNGKTSSFGKWFESEEKLLDMFRDHEVKFRYFYNCDSEFTRLRHRAVQLGLVSPDCPSTIIRNDSAEHLFNEF